MWGRVRALGNECGMNDDLWGRAHGLGREAWCS